MDMFKTLLLGDRKLSHGRRLSRFFSQLKESSNLGWSDVFELAGQGGPQVDQELADSDLTRDDLDHWLNRLGDFLDDRDLAGAVFLRRLDQLVDQDMRWPLLDKPLDDAAQVGSLSLNFGAALKASLMMDVLSQKEMTTMDMVPRSDSTLALKLATEGSVEGTAGAELPFTYGSFGTNISGGIAFWLDYFYEFEAASRLAPSMFSALRHLPYPTSAQGVAMSAQGGLREVELRVKGWVSLSANFKLGRTIAYERSTESFDGEQVDLSVEARLGAGVSARLTPRGEFSIKLTPDPGNKLVTVSLQRLRGSDENRSLNVGAQATINGLDEIISPLVEHYALDAQPLIDRLGELSKPSKWLESHINSSGLIADDNLRREVVDALFNVDSAQDLTQLMKARLKESLDRVPGDWIEHPDLLKAVWRAFVGELVLEENLAQRVADAGEAELGELGTEYSDAIREKLDEIYGNINADDDIKEIFATIDSIERDFTDGLITLDDKAEKTFRPLVRFLKKYQDYRSSLIKAAEAATSLKIGVNYLRQTERSESTTTMLAVSIDTTNLQAIDAFHRMVRGDFADVQALNDDGNSGVKLLGGQITRVLSDKRTVDFQFDLFGAAFAHRKVATSEVSATWDLNGRVLAWASRANYLAVARKHDELQMATFMTSRYIDSNNNAPTSVLFSATLSHEDENLDELSDFIRPIESHGLVAPGATEVIVNRLRLAGQMNGTGLRKARIGIAYSMSNEQWNRFLARPDDEVKRAAINNLLFSKRDLQIGFGEKFDSYIDRLDGDNSPLDYIMSLDVAGSTLAQIRRNIEQRLNDQYNVSTRPPAIAVLPHKLVGVVRKARSLSLIRTTIESIAELDAALDTSPDRADELNRVVNRAVSDWLSVRLVGDRPTADAIAFFLTVLELADTDLSSSPLIPVLSYQPSSGELQTVLID